LRYGLNLKTNSAAKALQIVAKSQYVVKIASGIDVAEYIAAGGVIEDGLETAETSEGVESEEDASEA
jgi:hypothetical protein